MNETKAFCESNGCVQVEEQNGYYRIRSTETNTVMQCTLKELTELRDWATGGPYPEGLALEFHMGGVIALTSATTGTYLTVTPAELHDWCDRIRVGELEHLDEAVAS